MKEEKVFTIIVTYNPNIKVFERQLKSLSIQLRQIIIVDNNSINFSEIESICQSFIGKYGLSIHFIPNSSNMGLGKAQNQGIDYARNHKAYFVLLLDQDSVLEDNFLKELLLSHDTLKNGGLKVGAVGPIYYNEATQEVYPISRYFGPFLKRIKPSKIVTPASFLIASGSLIPINVLDEVGDMDENLFIDYVDLEWAFRASKFGYYLFAVPNARMMHAIGENNFNVGGKQMANHIPLRRYYLFRNSLLLLRNKYVSHWFKLREIFFIGLRFVIFFIAAQDKKKYLQYSYWGFCDGLKGVGGMCKHQLNDSYKTAIGK